VFLFAFPAAGAPDDGILPNVVAKLRGCVRSLAEGRISGAARRVAVHQEPSGHVVLQEDPPRAADRSAALTSVLALSAGQKTAEVPVTTNMSQQQARIAIENTASHSAMSASSSPTSRETGDLFVSDSGTKMDLPGNVDIVLSKGPATVQMPDLYGAQSGRRGRWSSRSVFASRECRAIRARSNRRIPSSGNYQRLVSPIAAGGPVSLTVSHFPPPPTIRIDTLSRLPAVSVRICAFDSKR